MIPEKGMVRNASQPVPAPVSGQVLVADIGGTHSRFALFQLHPEDGGTLALSLKRRVVFRTREHENATELLSRLYRNEDEPALLGPGSPPPLATVLAIPAPASGRDPFEMPDKNECCPCPNIAWPICWAEANAVLGTDAIHLINDFVAQGFACGALPQALDPLAVLPGTPVPGTPVALMGAGTGFGQCMILPGPSPVIFPSEGGHSLFPFAGAEEFRYAAFLRDMRPDTPLIKDVILSGSGLSALYAFHTGKDVPAEDVSAFLAQHGAGHSAVLEWYARFYARACREYVLNALPLGGIFITGGMASRVPVFGHPAFAAELRDSRAMRKVLGKLPVFHVRNQSAGLWGAAVFAALGICGPVSLIIS